jgi:hypothetical protein
LYKDIPKCKYNDKLLKVIELNKSHLILLFCALLFCAFQSFGYDNYFFSYVRGQSVEQQPQYLSPQQASQSFQPAVAVKITSPTTSQNVSTGQLTITGTSTDTTTRECQVYADWNDRKPFQRVVAAGPAGNGDYSRWNYTYTATYHEITNGTNELTSKISCLANPTNLTKWYSINVTGIEGLIPQTESYLPSITQVQSNSTSNSTNFVSPLPTISAAQINPPVKNSEDSEDDDNEDEDSDNDREVEEEQEEEENSGEAGDIDVLNDDSNDEVMEEEEEDNGNAELFATNEDNRDDEEDGAAANDNIEVVDEEEEDESNGDVDNELTPDRGDDEEDGAAANDNIEVVDEEEEDESNGDVDNELTPDRGDDEEDGANPINDELEEDFVEENEDDNEETLGADNGDSNLNFEVNGDIGDAVDEEKPEESDTETFMDIPDLSISTIPSIPPIAVPDENEITQSIDEDDCDIGDAGFPFCDGGQGEGESNDDEDDCDIGDAGFPFCDRRRD